MMCHFKVFMLSAMVAVKVEDDNINQDLLIFLGRVAEDERIYRNIDDNEEKYMCPNDFVPVFSDQALATLNGELKEQAEAMCENNLACLFDIAATGQVAFGQSTLEESTAIANEIAMAG